VLFVCYSYCFVVNCDVLCIACKCVLPPGANSIAFDKYININININPIKWFYNGKQKNGCDSEDRSPLLCGAVVFAK
jgi:hypothetical protein